MDGISKGLSVADFLPGVPGVRGLASLLVLVFAGVPGTVGRTGFALGKILLRDSEERGALYFL